MLVPSLWSKQPGRFFCISTRTEDGKWRDRFFSREEFGEIRQYVKDHVDDDVYFCPHGFNRRARQKEEAVLPKMCWADLDYSDPKLLELKPTIALESSPGRFVGLWLTDEPITESINRRLTYKVEADHGGWDLTQVLRFPGTTNYKYEARPRVRTLWDDGPTYTVKKLERYLPIDEIPHSTEPVEGDAAELFEKYHREMPHWLRRELLSGKPQQGKRSEMLWKIEHALLESGLTQEEAFVLVKASPWNKFAGRRNEDEQLTRELEKVVGDHFKNFKGTVPKGRERLQKKQQDDKQQERRFLTKTMDEVVEEDLDWIWYPYLARGELTILEGDPGLGKSYMAQMIAGALVDGKALPVVKPQGKKPPQGAVVYFDMENSAGTVTKRRLVDNGVKNLKEYRQEETPFSIDDEDVLQEVYDAMDQINPIFTCFDTLNSYIGKADTHKSSEVQQAFSHFRQIAKDFNCAVLVLRHLTKDSKGAGKAIYRGQGSIAFTGLARVVMTVGSMPEDPDMKVMAVTKINVTRAPRALQFHIQELPNDHSKFHWGDFTDLTSDDMLAGPSKKNGAGNDLEDAKDFLVAELADGPLDVARLRRMGEKRSFSIKTLERAADALGVERFTTGFGKTKQAQWGMPPEKK